MDEALALWVSDCAFRNFTFSDAVIQKKEIRLKDTVDATCPQSEQVNIKFPNGSLQKFKKRHGLSRIVLHGEKASAETTGANDALTRFREQLVIYSHGNIFNADVFGLQYRLPPTVLL